jgi:hypothetical protein
MPYYAISQWLTFRLNRAIKDFESKTVREGLRVSLDILESHYGFSALSVRASEAQG